MTKIICPFCLETLIEDFNKIDLSEYKLFQCPNPKCNRLIGNPFYPKEKLVEVKK